MQMYQVKICYNQQGYPVEDKQSVWLGATPSKGDIVVLHRGMQCRVVEVVHKAGEALPELTVVHHYHY